jgi:hypothetical protein
MGAMVVPSMCSVQPYYLPVVGHVDDDAGHAKNGSEQMVRCRPLFSANNASLCVNSCRDCPADASTARLHENLTSRAKYCQCADANICILGRFKVTKNIENMCSLTCYPV